MTVLFLVGYLIAFHVTPTAFVPGMVALFASGIGFGMCLIFPEDRKRT